MKFCDGFEASLFPRRCELCLHFICVGRDFAHDGGVFRLGFYDLLEISHVVIIIR